MDGRKIKPKVLELSLAYDPANRKKFFMSKEVNMDELLELLKDEKLLLKGAEVDAFLTSAKVPEGSMQIVKGALKLLNAAKKDLPKEFLSALAAQVNDYGEFIRPEESKKVRDDREKGLVKEAQDVLLKDFQTLMDADPNRDQGGAVLKGLKAEVSELRKDNDVLKTNAAEEKSARRLLEIEMIFKDAKVPGDYKKMAKVFQTLEITDPEMAKDYRDQTISLGTALHATGLLSELGASGDQPPASAYTQLESKVKEKMGKDTGLNVSGAWKAVIHENPALYKEHLSAHKL